MWMDNSMENTKQLGKQHFCHLSLKGRCGQTKAQHKLKALNPTPVWESEQTFESFQTTKTNKSSGEFLIFDAHGNKKQYLKMATLRRENRRGIRKEDLLYETCSIKLYKKTVFITERKSVILGYPENSLLLNRAILAILGIQKSRLYSNLIQIVKHLTTSTSPMRIK